MHKTKQQLIALLAVIVLAGCATKSPMTETIALPTPTDLANRELLAYHQQLQDMPNAEQVREAKRLVSAPTSPANAMKLSLLLVRSHGAAEMAQAQSLLEAVLHNAGPDAQPYHPIARLMIGQISNHKAELRKWEDQQTDQKKAEEQLERQSQQLRDCLKKSELQNERLEILRTQVKSLTVKLEALKAIERSLPNRPSTAVNGAPP
ncbi:hypothetical protein [Chitinimonas sp. BJB300]|uniref:hypothetical protein n=1 Tax=Chitinimonas sp. BJB300 TaxID=1559339 RepID=UPI000C0F82E9|nr:hypothetical protein [Chitinimonas sp. BJB300]PHV10504.1 hypothetical protein CSQ89_15815 [Chitinimonas sp. BJB300]TSJ90752.1 hypothetical protein FG002_000035 [Chitinimonas sp. BJB300]